MESRVPIEVRLPDGVEVRQIAGGSNFACAVDTDGRVWCWGENGRGQLGDGTVRDRPVPATVSL